MAILLKHYENDRKLPPRDRGKEMVHLSPRQQKEVNFPCQGISQTTTYQEATAVPGSGSTSVTVCLAQ